jgi:glycosyltransferase involved in cell wall biosynthesis
MNRRLLAVAPVDDPGGPEIYPLRLFAGAAGVVYLNGTVCGRLLRARPGHRARRALHVHDIASRVPRFWRRADVVLADSGVVAKRLPGLDAQVVSGPVGPDPVVATRADGLPEVVEDGVSGRLVATGSRVEGLIAA